jgi:hypothetical protein
VQTIFHYLVAQRLVFGNPETKVFEKSWNAREKTNASDAAFLGLMEEGSNEQAACSMSLDLRANNDRAHLGEMRAVHMKSGTADELIPVRLDDGKSPDIFANFRIGPMEESPVMRETLHKLIDGMSIP